MITKQHEEFQSLYPHSEGAPAPADVLLNRNNCDTSHSMSSHNINRKVSIRAIYNQIFLNK